MDELEIAAGVLAAVALPLVGIGPMLLRTLPVGLVAAVLLACAVVVLLLTRAPWACAFTLCIGAAVLLRHRRARRRHAAPAFVDEGPLANVASFSGPRPDSEGDLA